jgi:hypothetical protein
MTVAVDHRETILPHDQPSRSKFCGRYLSIVIGRVVKLIIGRIR